MYILSHTSWLHFEILPSGRPVSVTPLVQWQSAYVVYSEQKIVLIPILDKFRKKVKTGELQIYSELRSALFNFLSGGASSISQNQWVPSLR